MTDTITANSPADLLVKRGGSWTYPLAADTADMVAAPGLGVSVRCFCGWQMHDVTPIVRGMDRGRQNRYGTDLIKAHYLGTHGIVTKVEETGVERY